MTQNSLLYECLLYVFSQFSKKRVFYTNFDRFERTLTLEVCLQHVYVVHVVAVQRTVLLQQYHLSYQK